VKVQRAHHISFGVSDLERARAFYGGLLGLPEIERPDFGFAGAWYQAGEAQVHLIALPDGFEGTKPSPTLNPITNHAAFEIADYDTVLAELQAKGVEVLPTGPEVGQLWIRDPDGNIIELIQPGGRLGRRDR
jgi:catechol 2,3-dioxygenase-like lactoylglutathione lyase family enzyme